MKKLLFLSTAIIVLAFTSCKKENHDDENNQTHMMNDSTMMDNDDHNMMDHDSTMNHNDSKMMDHAGMYSCPMHPEVHGNKGDKCTECGMDLTLTDSKESN